jgi:hypothetical protein
MTHKLPPDPARYSALLAPPRRHRLAVCLNGTTAFSPSLSMMAALLVSLAQGIVSQAAFPEAMLAPRRRWSVPSGTAADPAPCGEATAQAQRSPAGVPRTTAASGPPDALPEAAATPHALRQPPAIATAPAQPTDTRPARVTATPHAQRSPAGDRPAAAKSPPTGPPPEAAAAPHLQRQRPGIATARMPPTASHTAPRTATPHAQRPTPKPSASPTRLRACDTPPTAGAPARQHPMSRGSRGRLKNGAPGGDYLAAPRCGARTRAGGSCQQPAMPNGRCRLHGGKSTGARTEAGRERLRHIHTTHGGYGRDSLAWFRRVDTFIAETKLFMAESRRTGAVAAAASPAAGGPSGQNASRAGRSRPTRGSASDA